MSNHNSFNLVGLWFATFINKTLNFHLFILKAEITCKSIWYRICIPCRRTVIYFHSIMYILALRARLFSKDTVLWDTFNVFYLYRSMSVIMNIHQTSLTFKNLLTKMRSVHFWYLRFYYRKLVDILLQYHSIL
jgi:hypothetical protein